MKVIKEYKTISILIGLIIVFGILTVFIKVFDIGGVKTSLDVKITATPTPVLDPFIHPESLNIPSSYMGYTVIKHTQGNLGKSALKYGKRYVDLSGTQWNIKKSKVSDIEYGQVKSLIDAYIQGQIVNKGWKKTLKINGLEIAPNIPASISSALGYIQVSNGKFQEAMLEGSRDSSGNVEFKIFLSKIYDLKSL